jgi:hypothetical protein
VWKIWFIVLIILTRQEFLYIHIIINLAYIQVLNLEQKFTRKIAYHVIIVGSVACVPNFETILKINIWIHVFEVINAIKHSVCINYQHEPYFSHWINICLINEDDIAYWVILLVNICEVSLVLSYLLLNYIDTVKICDTLYKYSSSVKYRKWQERVLCQRIYYSIHYSLADQNFVRRKTLPAHNIHAFYRWYLVVHFISPCQIICN